MYRFVDHTAELGVELEAESRPALFQEALLALRELLGDEEAEEAVVFDVAVEAPDAAALLVAWLEELLYLAETEGLLPERAAGVDVTATALRARVEGRRGAPRPLVKAVTYHDLELRRTDRGWRARITLDV